MKEYFSHDYNARNDKKLVKIFMKYSLEGIGAYWCIIEMLYEEGGYLLRSEYERIAYELRTDIDLIKNIIEGFDLFKKDSKKFWSETAINRLNQRIEKSIKARESVNKRWEKYERKTNVKRKKNEGNTSKVKESKEKENKVYYRRFKHLKITIEENQKLLNLKYTQTEIDNIYNKIENYKKNTNYVSLYLTALDWLKREYSKDELSAEEIQRQKKKRETEERLSK